MNIIKHRKKYFAISIILILIGFAFMIYNGVKGNGVFNYDIQFIGGTSIEGNIGKDFANNDILQIVKENSDLDNAVIQKVDGNSVSIKTQLLDREVRDTIINKICEKYGCDKNTFETEDIGATISGEMKKSAFLAVFVACIAMLIYITFRFKELKTGASCVIALCNDVLIVLGCYAILRIPLNNSFIAAILTILGYSVNASIIIFDRIRENKRKISSRNPEELVNTSVMQTLRRSIFTSLTTLFTIASLYIFGVPSVKEFALPIIVGIICGAYSSVCISPSLWYTFTTFKKA